MHVCVHLSIRMFRSMVYIPLTMLLTEPGGLILIHVYATLNLVGINTCKQEGGYHLTLSVLIQPLFSLHPNFVVFSLNPTFIV